MKKLRFLLIGLLLLAVIAFCVSCDGTTDVENPVDGTEGNVSENTPEQTEKETFEVDLGDHEIPENVQLEESAILASAVEAWDLSDGGTEGTALSANSGTDASHRWGVWLKNSTFGFALDFSTQGSYAVAENSKVKLDDSFAVSAWVKAPVREEGKRVIVSEEAPAIRSYGEKLEFDNFERTGDWMASGSLEIVREGAKEGNGYLSTSIDKKGDLVLSKVFDRMDLSDYAEDGYLHMWVSVEGVGNIQGGQLEFTSSRSPDKNEAHYTALSVDGDGVWTEIYLKLSSGKETGGEINTKAVNFFRIYFNATGPVTLKLDDMYFCKEVVEKSEEGWQMFINENGELDFSAYGLEGLESSGCNIVDGDWHHTMVSYDGSTFIYYIDGVAVKAIDVTGTPVINSQNVYIGSDSEFFSHFDGSIAEVRIFDEAKTPGETTATVLDPTDNEEKAPRMDMHKGIVLDRRQYYGSDSRVIEPGAVVGYDDITAVINMGFDHVKLLLTPNHLINSDGTLKEREMEYITWVISHVTDQNFRAILCIHPESPFKETYLANLDQFEIVCKWYGELAEYIGEHWTPDQVSLQLMTEPYANNDSVEWTWMSDRMWGAVRNVLPEHTILTSSDSSGNIERLKLMSPATDENLIYTFTTYEPYTTGFSTFGAMGDPNAMWAYIKDVPYPIEEGVDYTKIIENCIEDVPSNMKEDARTLITDYINGVSDNGKHYVNHYDSLYNAEWHMMRAKSLDDWRQKYGGNIHIMCVEFGCMFPERSMATFAAHSLGISSESRYQFVKDMRSGFDAYDIGWSYWSYNEAFTIFVPKYALELSSKFPTADVLMQVIDYRMLEDSLGVTPKNKFEVPAALTDAVEAWKLNDNAEVADSRVILGTKGKYIGTTFEANDKFGYASVIGGDGSYIVAEDTGINVGRAFAVAADIKADNTGKVQTIVAQAEGMWEDPEYIGKYVVDSFDDVAGMWGMAAIESAKDDAAEGAGYAKSAGSELIVFCRAWGSNSHDISMYAENGKLHLSIFVEDASLLNPGTGNIELASDTNLAKVIAWTLPELKTGWNNITLDVSKANRTGADLTDIQMIRVFHYVTADTYIGIDNLFMSLDGNNVEPIINWELIVNEKGELEFVCDDLSGVASSGVVVADGQWHKVLVSYTGQNLIYYVDGKEVASVKASGMSTSASGSSDTFIGASSDHKNTLSGAIANVSIYSVPKTPEDIAE